MSIELTTQNTSLTTVAVELTVIKVGKKDMTKSVFTQIPSITWPDQSVVDDLNNGKYKIWGKVWYCAPGMRYNVHSWWLLVEHNGKLVKIRAEHIDVDLRVEQLFIAV